MMTRDFSLEEVVLIMFMKVQNIILILKIMGQETTVIGVKIIFPGLQYKCQNHGKHLLIKQTSKGLPTKFLKLKTTTVGIRCAVTPI